MENVAKSGYKTMTAVQKWAIPVIMAGRDLMACSQTGSGKTAAFLLPIIHSLIADRQDMIFDGQSCQPQAVIITPTRELAIQIHQEARKFALHSDIKTIVVYGGASVGYQRRHVESGCHIMVATPGRLNDFVTRGFVSFASTRFIVLDEADRMLDMGFLSEVQKVLEHETMVEMVSHVYCIQLDFF